jgi:hypothetical protein
MLLMNVLDLNVLYDDYCDNILSPYAYNPTIFDASDNHGGLYLTFDISFSEIEINLDHKGNFGDIGFEMFEFRMDKYNNYYID